MIYLHFLHCHAICRHWHLTFYAPASLWALQTITLYKQVQILLIFARLCGSANCFYKQKVRRRPKCKIIAQFSLFSGAIYRSEASGANVQFTEAKRMILPRAVCRNLLHSAEAQIIIFSPTMMSMCTYTNSNRLWW